MRGRQAVRVAVAATAVSALVLTGTACGSSSGGSTTSGGGGTAGVLRFATFTVPDTFDPVKRSSGSSGLNFLYPVYDSLLRTDPTGKITAGLATSWQLQPDGLQLTLRNGVSFSDGTPLDAEAVKANLQRCKDAGGGCGSTLAAVQSIQVVGKDTVRLATFGPQPSLLLTLTTGTGMMVSPKAFNSPDLGRDPVGSGPFVLDTKDTVDGAKWVYTKNPHYWDPSAQKLDRLEIDVIQSAQQRVAALRTGQVDASMIGDAQELASDRKAGFATSVVSGGDPIGLMVVDPSGPLADQRVRQAIGYAIDRKTLTGTPARQGMSTVANQLFSAGNIGHVDDPGFSYTYDPDKAKALLAAAGAHDVQLTIPSMPGPQNKTETEAVAGMLNAVGFKATVVSPPPQNIGREIFSGKYQVVYIPIFVSDAPSLADGLSPKFGFMNPKHTQMVDALGLAEQAAAAFPTDEAKSTELYGRMMSALAEQGWVIPAFWSPTGVAYAKNVHGLQAWAGAYMGPPVWGVSVAAAK
jgi:peptide/nickel transport system substrate-binding protein